MKKEIYDRRGYSIDALTYDNLYEREKFFIVEELFNKLTIEDLEEIKNNYIIKCLKK
jgi:hypothetical protein